MVKAAASQYPSVPPHVQEEEYNPWGRPGGGAPPLKGRRNDKLNSDSTQRKTDIRLTVGDF